MSFNVLNHDNNIKDISIDISKRFVHLTNRCRKLDSLAHVIKYGGTNTCRILDYEMFSPIKVIKHEFRNDVIFYPKSVYGQYPVTYDKVRLRRRY